MRGWRVADSESEAMIGTINKVLDYAIYPILEVTSNGKEVLITLPAEIDIRVNRAERQLFVTIPDGLLEIYLGTSEETKEHSDSLWDGDANDDEEA